MTLDNRKGRILQAIVQDYVETADPIGSEWLATHYDFGCRSATLRNEMAEMSDLGYLIQPHTSAGRIPSQRGYRYYVDRLMPQPGAEEIREPAAFAALDAPSTPVDEIVQQTCRILAGMTHYPSAATQPSARSASFHRFYLTPASRSHILLVLLISTGDVEHRVLDLESPPRPGALNRIANFLNQRVAGLALDEIAARLHIEMPSELAAERELLGRVLDAVVAAAHALSDDRVFVEGTSHILRQPEFQDIGRLEQLLSALEERSVLYEALSRALLGDDVTVVIGAEGRIDAMRECSVVSSSYRIGDRVGGFIGVVGPTRMNYGRAVSAVGLMARNLSALLTRHTFR